MYGLACGGLREGEHGFDVGFGEAAGAAARFGVGASEGQGAEGGVELVDGWGVHIDMITVFGGDFGPVGVEFVGEELVAFGSGAA